MSKSTVSMWSAVVVATIALASCAETSPMEPIGAVEYLLAGTGASVSPQGSISCSLTAVIARRDADEHEWLGYAQRMERDVTDRRSDRDIRRDRSRMETPVSLDRLADGTVRLRTWMAGSDSLMGREVEPGVFVGTWTCFQDDSRTVVAEWVLKAK